MYLTVLIHWPIARCSRCPKHCILHRQFDSLDNVVPVVSSHCHQSRWLETPAWNGLLQGFSDVLPGGILREIASLQACTSQLPVLGDVMNRNTHLGLARPTGPHICGEGVGQGYSITNSVGPDFQNKKFSWARHFQLQVMTHFGPTQMNVLKYTNVLLTVTSEKLH